MKRRTLALTLACLTAGGFAIRSDEDARRIGDLEAEVQALRLQVDATVHYLHLRAKAAAELEGVLDRSKELGFTYGINYTSREVMLDGFHGYLSGLRSDLPKVVSSDSDAPKVDD